MAGTTSSPPAVDLREPSSWRKTKNQITTEQAFDRVAVPMKKFMLAHVRQADLKLFLDMSNTKPPKNAIDLSGAKTRRMSVYFL